MGQPSYLLASAHVVLRDALRSGLRFHAAVVVACPSAVPSAWPVSVGSGAVREREGLRCCERPRAAGGSVRLSRLSVNLGTAAVGDIGGPWVDDLASASGYTEARLVG